MGFLLLENFRHYCLDLQVCTAVEFAEVESLGFEFLENVPHFFGDEAMPDLPEEAGDVPGRPAAFFQFDLCFFLFDQRAGDIGFSDAPFECVDGDLRRAHGFGMAFLELVGDDLSPCLASIGVFVGIILDDYAFAAALAIFDEECICGEEIVDVLFARVFDDFQRRNVIQAILLKKRLVFFVGKVARFLSGRFFHDVKDVKMPPCVVAVGAQRVRNEPFAIKAEMGKVSQEDKIVITPICKGAKSGVVVFERKFTLAASGAERIVVAEPDGGVGAIDLRKDVTGAVEDAVGFYGAEAFDVLIGAVDHGASSLYSITRL